MSATDTTAPSTDSRGAGAIQPQKRKSDKYIWAIYILLCVVSIIELYSASSFEVRANNIFMPLIRHCILLGLGAGIVYAVSRVNYRWCIAFTPLFILLSVGLAAYVLMAGEVVNGARRSLTIFGFMIQPAEFLKISAVLAISMFMTKFGGNNSNRGIIYSGVAVMLFGGLLFFQGLTNTILLMGISVSMMIIACIPWWKLGVLLLVYGMAAGRGLGAKVEAQSNRDEAMELTGEGRIGTWQGRIERFLGIGDSLPKYEQPINGTNAQEMYSYMAQAHGGVIGVMPGNSRETSRLPLAFSAFIYSIVVEEWGFIGAMVVLLILTFLVWKIFIDAGRADNRFGYLMCIGIGAMFMVQILINVGMCLGIMPVIGLTLPFISYGGTSVMTMYAALGMVCGLQMRKRPDRLK